MFTMNADNKEDVLKILSLESLPDIMNCLSNLDAPYDDPKFFISPTAEYLETILSGYGKSVGLYHGSDLVAFASIAFPKTGQNNLGHLINLSRQELRKVVQLEHSFVVPKYRGNGISNYLYNYLVQPIENEYDCMLSTVSPQNKSSLSAAFKRKQRIILLTNIYCHPRFLLYRNLHENGPKMNDNHLSTPISDLKRIDVLLKNSYQGWAFADNSKSILFARWKTNA